MQKLMGTQGIVCHAPEDGKRQWRIETVWLTPPEKDEAIVEMVSTGICHTDLGCGTLHGGASNFPDYFPGKSWIWLSFDGLEISAIGRRAVIFLC